MMGAMTESTLTTTPADSATETVAPRGGMVMVARIYFLILACIGTASFLVSCYLSMTAIGNGGALNGLVFTLSYFTIWSNIFVAIVTWTLVANPRRDGNVFRWLRLTSLVMITITGLVYALVLAKDAHPTGLGVYTNLGFHYIAPWASVLGFLLFGPRPRFTMNLIPKMLVIPVLWLTYTLIHGAFMTTPPPLAPETVLGQAQHWYPYPFINVNDPAPLLPGVSLEGYAGVGVNIVVIVILGLLFGLMFVGLDRVLSGRRQPTPL